MPEGRDARVDVVIFGGGVAGLWCLNRLRAAGYSVLLLEADRLGAGQTIAAQGIIHGGLKYALDLQLTEAARAIADMPGVWRRCFAGEGEIDLRAAILLAPHCHFWLPPGMLGRATGFFASKAVRSKAMRLAPGDWPEALRGCPSVGAVYALDEPVVDVPSLLAALAAPHADCIRRIDWPGGAAFELDSRGSPIAVRLHRPGGAAVRLAAGCFVCLAGSGNEQLLAQLPRAASKTQRRPLQMAMLKGMPHRLYAHCFEASDKPRLTVTSHAAADGRIVWYLGGQLAETGTQLSPAELIAKARLEVATLLPGIDLTATQGAAFAIDRAEPRQSLGRRPDRPVLEAIGTALVAWPTKLAFAPALASQVLAQVHEARIAPSAGDQAALQDWPHPGFAAPPWEQATWS